MRQDEAIEGALTTKHEGGWRNKDSNIKQNQQKMEKLLHTITTKGEITLIDNFFVIRFTYCNVTSMIYVRE